MRYGCEQCREEVAVRDGLSHLARARLAAHLEACTSCRSFADRWATTLEHARASAPTLGEATKDGILDLVCARCEPARGERIPRWRAAAVVVVPVALLLFAIVHSRTEVTGPPTVPVNAVRDGSASVAPPAPLPVGAPSTAAAPRSAASAAPRVQRTRAPAQLEERPRAAPVPPVEIAPPRTGVLPHRIDPGSLYADAERALAEGRAAEAARILEDLVGRAPEAPEAQTARLELGRLYAGALGRPARAVAHVSAFVAREREPSARRAAKGLLCPLLPAAERNRVCWPGVAALGGSSGSPPSRAP
ncbi:MAG TPA: hypothetical protein VFL83_06210 [Anaeromyxobacter sp.]|nr:hypothetical protein [Anaeromyxobacter sp.]